MPIRRPGYLQALAAVVLFAIALIWYSLLIPMWRAPDERAHVDLVLDLAEDESYPAWDENRFSVGVYEASLAISGAENRIQMDKLGATPRSTRPTFDELGGLDVAGPRNSMAQHPPAYYTTLAAGFRVVSIVVDEDALSAERVESLLRLLNIGIMLLLPAICWWTARRVGLDGPTATAAALVPLCIPGLCQIGSAVNNDNLLTVSIGVVVALAVGIARGDRRRSTAVAVGVATMVALLTKLFAVVLLPIVAIAYWRAARDASRASVVRLAATSGAFIAVGLSWYVINLARYGEVNPTTDTGRFGTAPAGFTPDLHEWSTTLGTFLAQGFWGRPGKFEVPLPTVYMVVATVVLLGLALLGAVQIWRSRGRTTMLLLLLPLPLILVMVAGNSYRLYSSSGQLAFMHGRYLMPAVTGVAVLFAAGIRRLFGARPALIAPALLVGALVMHRMALLKLMAHFWGPPRASLADTFRSAAAWSPWPGALTGALAVASVLAALAALVVLVRPPGDTEPSVASGAL